MTAENTAERVAKRADQAFDETLEQLCAYLRIPAISCDEAYFGDVRKLAERIREDLEALGLDNAHLLELPEALPCVAAEWLHAGPDAPTILIYGHLDLQPVNLANWRTDPHEPVVVDGRLYGRGAADDMGGWISHLAALKAWKQETGGFPCNVRLLIEGEEEIGSPNLERFMDTFPQAFDSDVMVLTDCENPSTSVPGLTVSLRGLLEVELTCSSLQADGHSGLWGGMVPDPAIALIQLIGRLVDEDGRMKVGRVDVGQEWAKASFDVPLNNEVIRKGSHMLEGVDPLPLRGRSAAEWMWRQPALTVVATTLPTPAEKKNAIRTHASATLSIRVAPGMSSETLWELVQAELTRDAPQGVLVEAEQLPGPGEGWLYTPKGPAFEAADRAYVKSWGAPLVQVGVGGSIPFVALFGRRFGDLPLILNGVMDPLTTAHGPNESMDLGIFRKAIAANVFLLDELAALGKAGLKA